jgi:hypothetical protein
LWAATATVIGAMIGQSVFLVASDMSREVGSVTNVLTIWIIGGAVVLLGAFCYAELGAAMPEAGGDYIYLSRGLIDSDHRVVSADPFAVLAAWTELKVVCEKPDGNLDSHLFRYSSSKMGIFSGDVVLLSS